MDTQHQQLQALASLSGAAAVRASALISVFAGSGLALLRCAPSAGGFDILLSSDPARYAEVHVTQDGEAVALAREGEYEDAVMLAIPRGCEAARARLLAKFLRGSALSLDA